VTSEAATGQMHGGEERDEEDGDAAPYLHPTGHAGMVGGIGHADSLRYEVY
jgi:hypothetical protein